MPIARKSWNSYFHWKLTQAHDHLSDGKCPFPYLAPCKSLRAQQSRLSHIWLSREAAHPFYVSWPRAFLNILFTGLSVFHGSCARHKLFISSFLSTWLLHHCDTQMSKRWWDGRLSNPLLGRGSWQQQMLPVTWEITLTIATYQVQGQSELLANAAKVEFLSSCLNNL